jgi:asparagine synthase (glutamine-hydrolysing)
VPGIAGVIGNDSPENARLLVNAMIATMNTESFYASGVHSDEKSGVYAAWVAHENSFASQNCQRAGRDEQVLLISGECFPTSSPEGETHKRDTLDLEYILGQYIESGEAALKQINGLFSGLLIDPKSKRAMLFNDRYGIERLYYYEKGQSTYFASEAKALLKVLPELRAFDPEGVAQFINFGCTLQGRTLFNNLRVIPAGSAWAFDAGKCTGKQRYFDPENQELQPTLDDTSFELRLNSVFERIMPPYLSSNAPIGISLTGGLDTRMIMSCLRGLPGQSECYTFDGPTGQTLDTKLAARVAETCGLKHQIVRIEEDFFTDFGKHVDRTVYTTDGTAGALTAHEIHLNALARQISPIRLTGNFGSEVLRSVSTFKPFGITKELLAASFRETFNGYAQAVPSNDVHPVTFSAFREIPWNLFGTLTAARSQITFRTPYLDNEIVELAYLASIQSRKSPQSALQLVAKYSPELARIPTDRGLISNSGKISQLSRRIFAEVMFKLDYLYAEGLPHRLSPLDPILASLSKTPLLGQHKFLRYRRWFKTVMADYVGDVLTDDTTRKMPYFDSQFLETIYVDHLSGRKNYTREIHTVLTLEAIDRIFIRGE